MKPITFPEQNAIYAQDQAQYLPLPAYRNEVEVISFWELTWKERFRIFFTGRLWHRQMNFGAQLQAVSLAVESPFTIGPDEVEIIFSDPSAKS